MSDIIALTSNTISAREACLQARRLCVRVGAAHFDEVLHEGEILGVAGLDGHGQEEFLETLCGLRKPVDGEVLVRTQDGGLERIRSFRSAARAGVAYLPRDRKSEGVFPSLSVLDNFSMVILRRMAWLGVISRRRLVRRYSDFQALLSIVAPSPSAPITSLSGGNQQKVLLARWLATGPRVLVLNDPTRGVDLATRLALHDVLRDLAKERMALVLLSTEIEELLQLCHRVLVFREGSIFTELRPPAMTLSAIVAAMFGRRDVG
jgi:ribose transport system ATP-binding protein